MNLRESLALMKMNTLHLINIINSKNKQPDPKEIALRSLHSVVPVISMSNPNSITLNT